MFKIFVLTSLTCVLAIPTAENIDFGTPYSLKKDCGKGILKVPCLKIAAITFLEKINKKPELTLFPGIVLVKDSEGKTGNSVAVELARSSEEKLDKYLMYQLGAFLETHSVKLSLIDDTAVEEVKNVIEARSQKKKNGWAVIVAMAAMMKGTLMSIGLGGLAMLAGKALMTAMMSLLLSAIIGIKSLSGGQKSTTYEIVSKPVYSHSHSHSTAHEDVGGGYGHSGYGRSLNTSR